MATKGTKINTYGLDKYGSKLSLSVKVKVIKNNLPKYAENVQTATQNALIKAAQEARKQGANDTPLETGALANPDLKYGWGQDKFVVYLRWLAMSRSPYSPGFYYAPQQDRGYSFSKKGTKYYFHPTHGGSGFMDKTLGYMKNYADQYLKEELRNANN